MTVAYLGPSGSFTYNVAKHVFVEERLQPFSNITEVITAYEEHQVDYAVVPVENSIEGSVHETIDYLFHHAHLHAICEVIQPIQQCLLGLYTDQRVEKIFSHPQAIAQGNKYIKHHYPEATLEFTASTAYAAKFVSENPDKPYAAIAPCGAKDEYHLKVLARDIQEIDANYTRFWIFGSEKIRPRPDLLLKSNKMSLAITLPDNMPGSLYKALSVFAWRQISLAKIESRPLKTVLGEYFFIIDLTYHDEKLVLFALEELSSLGIFYKILGNYDVYMMVMDNKD